MVHGAISLMGWIDAMSPEVDRIADFLSRITLERDARMTAAVPSG